MIITTAKQLTDWFQSVNYKELAFDTETTSLDYTILDITGCSFSDGTHHCYIDILDNPDRCNIISILKYFFHEKADRIIMHNAPFDLKVLHKIGIDRPTENIFCTQTAAHLLNEEAPKGLKFIAETLFGVQTEGYLDAEKYGYHSEKFYQYAMNDAIWTYKIYKIFQQKLTQQNLDILFYKIEMPFQFCLRDLEVNGIKVNLKANDELRQHVDTMLYDLTQKMCEYAKIPYTSGADLFGNKLINPSVNFNSDQQIVKIFGKLKLKITERTEPSKTYPEGQPSVGKETLVRLSGHPFVDMLSQYRKLIKLKTGFIEQLESFVSKDGRLRANFNNTVAVTGRLSSSKPNLQQLPRKNEELNTDFRKVYVADTGKSFVAADFGGQELRLLADLSKDQNMCNSFFNNKDLHLMTANKIFNLNIPDAMLFEAHAQHESVKKQYKEQRHIGKNGVNFPIVYGSTASSIGKSLKVSQAVAQSYIDGFMSLYPGVKQSMARCKTFLMRNLYVYNRTGRRRRFKHFDNRAFRQAYNFLIQSTAADMTKACMVSFRRFILQHPEWEAKLVLTVHDEIVVEVRDEYIEPAKKCLEYCMVNTYKISVPLVAEVSVGKSYSECK